MFHPDDYKKALDKMTTATPADMADAMKPMADYQAKLSQITLDAAKKNLATGQAMVNETMDALDRLAKSGPEATDMAAASSEFAAKQGKAMQKHMAAFVDIAKMAQAEAMEVILAAGEVAATSNTDEAAQEKVVTTPDVADSRTSDNTAAMDEIKKDVLTKTAKK
jgi:hypothetical protein